MASLAQFLFLIQFLVVRSMKVGSKAPSNRVSSTQSPLPGNGIFRAETKRPKRPWRFGTPGQRQNLARNPANSGLIAGFREISVRTRMRGGAERTRTACQARSRYRTGLSRVSSAATILRSNVAERQHYPERTGIRAPLERYCALISGARGAPRSCPAGSIAEVGLRWCGATPRNRTEDLKCQSLQRSDRWRQRQLPFQRQNHRDTVLAILSLRGPIAARSNRPSSPCCNHPRAQRSKR